MTTLRFCPLCNEDTPRHQTAFISPWIRELSKIKRRKANYRFCQICTSGFLDYRYSADEMDRLYRGYREPHYFQTRAKWEPTYTEELNHALADDDGVLKLRHKKLLECLTLVGDELERELTTVVDIGGDRGQFIPPNFPFRYVLEASQKPLVSGVQRAKSLAHAKSLQPDLVIASGILEHLPNPVTFFRDIVNLKTPNRFMYIYIEVPFGVPRVRSKWIRAVNYVVGSFACRMRKAWPLLDKYSAKYKLSGKSAAHFFPMRQSEHLNFFSESGLKRLVETSGAVVCLVDRYTLPFQLSSSPRLQFSESIRCLAKVK